MNERFTPKKVHRRAPPNPEVRIATAGRVLCGSLTTGRPAAHTGTKGVLMVPSQAVHDKRKFPVGLSNSHGLARGPVVEAVVASWEGLVDFTAGVG